MYSTSPMGETAGRLLTPMTLQTPASLFCIYRVSDVNCIHLANTDLRLQDSQLSRDKLIFPTKETYRNPKNSNVERVQLIEGEIFDVASLKRKVRRRNARFLNIKIRFSGCGSGA